MKKQPIRISKDSNWHLLSDFLNGDASFWARRPDCVETSCGGNAYWWKSQGEDILLTFQHGPTDRQGNVKDPGILVSKELLWLEINKQYKFKGEKSS